MDQGEFGRLKGNSMTVVKVKICGITNLDDALAAVDHGADALGFVFYEKSPRVTKTVEVKEIVKHLPPFVTTVGVFVNEHPSRIKEIMEVSGLDIVQLHGDEQQDLCNVWPRVIKAFRVRDFMDLDSLKKYKVSAYLLDTYTSESYGGTGELFNWDIALDTKQFGKIILSGGLKPDNIERAVRWVRPYAVDVSTGVEDTKRRKDHQKMRLFIEAAKRV